MARRASFDVAAGRQYLASLPEFHPAKPLAEYKPATIKRYVSQFQAQQGAGVPISRQAARGHVVTPEHGPRGAKPKLPPGAKASDYRGGKLPKSKYLRKTDKLARPRIHKRPINVPERLDLSDGAVVYTYQTDRAIIFQLERVIDVGADDRVILTGFDCEHNIYRSLGRNVGHGQGWTASALLDSWRASGLDFEDWFIAIANSTDSDPQQAAEMLGHVCLWTLYVYPRNDHLQPRRPLSGASRR